MKLKKAISVAEIAKLLATKAVLGNANLLVEHLDEIQRVKKGSLIFIDNDKYLNQGIYSPATAVLVDKMVDYPTNKALIWVENPFEAFNLLAKIFSPFIAMTATISPNATIGENTIIEANAVIGDDVQIGKNCLIRANVVICSGVTIGDNVVIESNSTIGSDAFYHKKNQDKTQTRLHSIGRVVIEDEVEIGSNCTIDKSITGETRIGFATKIDNQVHLAYGVQIGRHCYIAAQAGISGNAIIQDYVSIYGQAGVSNSVVIGEGAVILAQAGVSKSLAGGKSYFGSPALESRVHYREIAALRRLPDFLQRFDRTAEYTEIED
jgi:UDP-3-O-[3-hydroxymyristoyl] glucosamine N-acyltransferase